MSRTSTSESTAAGVRSKSVRYWTKIARVSELYCMSETAPKSDCV